MARRRMIDPNFWESEDVSKLTIRQRLLLVGLFSNADDEGKLRGNPAFIRSAVFKYEDFTLSEIEQDLNEIQSIGSIIQYKVEDNKYIKLLNWLKFQRVDKPQKSVIPNPLPNGENHSNNHSKNESEIDYCLKESKGKEVEDKLREEEEKRAVPTDESDSNGPDEISIKSNQLEKHFCQKRGKGLQASTEDYKIMQEIMAYGITVDSAKASIDNCFAEYKPKHPRDAISTFSYCAARCYDDWNKILEKSKPITLGGEQNAKYGGSAQGFQSGRDSPTKPEDSITGGQTGWIGRNKRNNELPLPDV